MAEKLAIRATELTFELRIMLKLTNVGRSFNLGGSHLTVLKEINLEAKASEFISITGHSGSGKSTLLGIMAGLDKPSHGQIVLAEKDITSMPESELARFRGQNTGFIFQNYQLMPTLTALENVMVPAELLHLGRPRDIESRAKALLDDVQLLNRQDHYPSQLSGGEMQRVAIARALIAKPKIIFADEPTGNLDSKNGRKVLELLTNLHEQATLVLVTHNPQIAALADREIRLHDGEIVAEIEPNKNNFFDRTLKSIRQWLPS